MKEVILDCSVVNDTQTQYTPILVHLYYEDRSTDLTGVKKVTVSLFMNVCMKLENP